MTNNEMHANENEKDLQYWRTSHAMTAASSAGLSFAADLQHPIPKLQNLISYSTESFKYNGNIAASKYKYFNVQPKTFFENALRIEGLFLFGFCLTLTTCYWRGKVKKNNKENRVGSRFSYDRACMHDLPRDAWV